jgi:Type II secretion system (T2SS), protein K
MKFRRHHSRRAIVLILVLIIVATLSLGSFAYVELMRTHREATVLAGQQLQTKLMVDSGVEYVRSFLKQAEDSQTELGGHYNNPDYFRQMIVVPHTDPKYRGCFTVIAPAQDEEGNLAGVRYGLEDESARLNLNALLTLEKQQEGVARTLLMALPKMTESTADAILDWLDPDTEPREFGAENEYYSTLEPPYAVKNAPLATVEELLRVRGVTPDLLIGRDVNRNGQLDAAEVAREQTNEMAKNDLMVEEDQTGSLDRGWAAYLTLYGRERNWNPQGQPRIYLNQPDLQQLHDQLSEVFPADWVTFLVAYRLGTPTTSGMATSSTKSLDLTKKPKTNFVQVLDVIDAKTQVTFAGDSRPTVLDSPFKSDLIAMKVYLSTLLDHVTVNPADTIPGRLNILQAPATLIRGIPGMDETIAQQIIDLRQTELENPSEEAKDRRHETWLLTEGVVNLTQMKVLMPLVNSGGHVYRAQIVGYFQHGEAAARAEAIFDASRLVPRLLLWRDMSQLGRGYALETLGLDYSE